MSALRRRRSFTKAEIPPRILRDPIFGVTYKFTVITRYHSNGEEIAARSYRARQSQLRVNFRNGEAHRPTHPQIQ